MVVQDLGLTLDTQISDVEFIHQLSSQRKTQEKTKIYTREDFHEVLTKAGLDPSFAAV